jgi:ZIP family zinc transporter
MVGAFLVILCRDKCVKKQRTLLIIEAVVMLILSAELTIQGLINNAWQAITGFIIGAALMIIINKLIPHKHSVIKRLSILVIIGFLIHEIPEGMSMGISLLLDVNYGLITAILIGLQNFPEGAIVALPMVLVNKSNKYVLWIVFITQVFFAIPSIISFTLLSGFNFNSLLLTMAAGAMTYLVYEEVIYNKKSILK